MEKYTKINNLVLQEDSKSFYGIVNTECPICGEPNNIFPIPLFKLGNIGYCLECYYNSMSSVIDN